MSPLDYSTGLGMLLPPQVLPQLHSVADGKAIEASIVDAEALRKSKRGSSDLIATHERILALHHALSAVVPGLGLHCSN